MQALREIYESGDEGVIDAIHSNLVTFLRTVRTDRKLKETEHKVDRLNTRCYNTDQKVEKLEAAIERLTGESEKKGLR